MSSITSNTHQPLIKVNLPDVSLNHFLRKFHGFHISPFQKAINFIAPQVVNAAFTASFIFLGVFTANPWLVTSTAVAGTIQAISLGHAWYISKGYLGASTPSLWATIAQIGAAFFGNILGGTSSIAKMITAFSTAAITAASIWNVHFAADLEEIHAEFGK